MFIYVNVSEDYGTTFHRRGVSIDNISYFEETKLAGQPATYVRLKMGGMFSTTGVQADGFACRETFDDIQSKIAIAQEK